MLVANYCDDDHGPPIAKCSLLPYGDTESEKVDFNGFC